MLVDDLGVHHNTISLSIFSLFFSASFLGCISLTIKECYWATEKNQAAENTTLHYISSTYAQKIFGH